MPILICFLSDTTRKNKMHISRWINIIQRIRYTIQISIQGFRHSISFRITVFANKPSQSRLVVSSPIKVQPLPTIPNTTPIPLLTVQEETSTRTRTSPISRHLVGNPKRITIPELTLTNARIVHHGPSAAQAIEEIPATRNRRVDRRRAVARHLVLEHTQAV